MTTPPPMVFTRKDRRNLYCRVRITGRRPVVRSTFTTDPDQAEQISRSWERHFERQQAQQHLH